MQWPGIFDKSKKRGETKSNFIDRLKETGFLPNWRPTDGRGVREDTGGSGVGSRSPQQRKPNP
jgi:hypothetical protein